MATENFFIKETTTTPEISFNLKRGYLELKGVSLPEDTEGFYRELFDYLDRNKQAIADKKITVALMFLYLNTASSAMVSRLLKFFERTDDGKNNVTIKWFYEEEDDDMEDVGKDFSTVTDLPFEILPTEEII